MRSTKQAGLAFVVATLAATGCGQGLDATEEEDVAIWEALRSSGATHDELLLEVGRRVPGFGGSFADEDGNLRVYISESAPLSAKEDQPLKLALSQVFGKEAVPAGNLQRVRGRYRFAELKEWQDRASQGMFATADAVMTDVDEAQNRVRVSLRPGADRQRALEHLAKNGVPQDAVILEEHEEFQEMATLTQTVRPIVGGLQIAWSNYVCTLGFHATRAGVAGFVTNSHCSNTRGVVTPTQYYQASASAANHVAVETTDPPFFTGGACPAGRQCRYSDTIFARRDAGVTATMGAIARVNLGSFTILGNYRIVSEGAVAVNTTLNKVGRTTGRTQGPVTATCADIGVSGSSIVMKCQGLVTAGVNGGDSGSPVFQIVNSPSANDVKLVGILWGGGGGSFVYSPIANIQQSGEMGALSNCASGFTC